jgi:N-acetylmuramoyl-L-alanine amidase
MIIRWQQLKKRACWGLFFIIVGTVGALASTLTALEVRKQQGKTSLVFSLTEAVPYKVFTLVNPDRLVVDFENTRLLMKLEQLHVDPRLIKHVRSGRPYPGTLRLVFELTQAVSSHANSWTYPHDASQFRVDLATKHITRAATSTVAPMPSEPVRSETKTLMSPKPMVIVIDAGHGGKDPGAHGPLGTREKHVTLSIARQLKAFIDRDPHMKAVLTRRGDYYIGLRERLDIARKHNPDLFISIHADAYHQPESSGASVFALSQKGATSEAARWLAEKENYSELGGVNLAQLHDTNGVVRTVLIDLSQTATIGASLQMGERVLKQLGSITELHNHHVEQARFVVLKSPDIPSILIETGFISNPREEKNLANASVQQTLAQAIFRGIKTYFNDYPPQLEPHPAPIRVNAQVTQSAHRHLVRSGESLSKIAQRYHVPMSVLRSMNHVPNDQVMIGQVLRLPS